jgi:hypothetical protein
VDTQVWTEAKLGGNVAENHSHGPGLGDCEVDLGVETQSSELP